MQRPLAIVGFVFVVGFGLGYGTTWFLAGSPGALDAPPPPVGSVAVAPPTPSAPPPVIPQPIAPVAAAPVVVADVSEEAPEVAEPAEEVVDADTVADAAADASDSVDAGPTPSAAAPSGPTHPCVGRVCRLDFMGLAGGLPVRNAELKNGQAVEWGRTFQAAPKLGFVPSGPSVNVEVRAVGYKDGVPVAASVVYRSRGKVLSGVISLTVGTKQLSLIPE